MRIGMISPYSLTMPGGVQGQVLGLARALRRQGHGVRVLGPCDGPPPEAAITPLGASIFTAVNGSVAPFAPDPSAQLRMVRALRDERFDVIHLHEPMVPGVTSTTVLLAPCPMVGTYHAAGNDAIYQVLNRLLVWGNARLAARCAVSQDALAMAQGALGGEFELLFNGIDLDQFQSVDPSITEGPTVFFCGRHEERKGLTVLLDALDRLPDEVQLWVASDGPQTADLMSDTAGNRRITWLGRISEAEKVARMRGANVFCAPSLHGESFGIVLLEAMAAHTPVVASNLPGYAKVTRGDQHALLCEPGDATALAESLRVALFDSSVAARLRKAGAERAEELSMDRLARLYLQIYERVAGAPRNPDSERVASST